VPAPSAPRALTCPAGPPSSASQILLTISKTFIQQLSSLVTSITSETSETEGIFTQGSRPGRTAGGQSVGFSKCPVLNGIGRK